MDEPKRRARRVQNEYSEPLLQEPIQAEPRAAETEQDVQGNCAHRRRRIQSNQPVPEEAAHAKLPQKTHKTAKNNAGRTLAQAAVGVVALLGLVGETLRCMIKKVRREHLRLAAMALCACVALVSAWQVGSIVLRSARTNRLNDELSRQRAAIIEAQEETAVQQSADDAGVQTVVFAPETTPEPVQADQEEVTPVQAETTAAPDVVKSTKYRKIGGDALPEMAKLYEQNRDLVAWVQIPDVLDLPVVYRDNNYYLTRDFSKQKNASGTIFLDKNHPFKEKTQNLLLHGHNMKDGTMFGRLAQYLYDDTYLRNHPFINFDTLWNKEQYVIFAVLDVSLDPSDSRFFNYFTHDTFSSDAEFAMYIRRLLLRSRYAIPIDVEPSDALLTLSTCLDEDRLVIVARRLREGEARSELRTLIRMATKQ